MYILCILIFLFLFLSCLRRPQRRRYRVAWAELAGIDDVRQAGRSLLQDDPEWRALLVGVRAQSTCARLCEYPIRFEDGAVETVQFEVLSPLKLPIFSVARMTRHGFTVHLEGDGGALTQTTKSLSWPVYIKSSVYMMPIDMHVVDNRHEQVVRDGFSSWAPTPHTSV